MCVSEIDAHVVANGVLWRENAVGFAQFPFYARRRELLAVHLHGAGYCGSSQPLVSRLLNTRTDHASVAFESYEGDSHGY